MQTAVGQDTQTELDALCDLQPVKFAEPCFGTVRVTGHKVFTELASDELESRSLFHSCGPTAAKHLSSKWL